MTAAAFAERMVGVPWVRWACGWSACDCYGLLVLYYREVLGIELGDVPETDLATGFWALRGRWVQCGPEPGVSAFMSFDAAGVPAHCGVMIDGGLMLHADGDATRQGGAVRATRLAALLRLFPDTRFYRYAPPC